MVASLMMITLATTTASVSGIVSSQIARSQGLVGGQSGNYYLGNTNRRLEIDTRHNVCAYGLDSMQENKKRFLKRALYFLLALNVVLWGLVAKMLLA